RSCPSSDPSAPPVAMIGPSAPNGPPVPIDTAADSGLRNVTRAGIRLSASRTFSIVSGIPCPRIAGDPYLAISPTITPPITGIATTTAPRSFSPGARYSVPTSPRNARFVISAISSSSPCAAGVGDDPQQHRDPADDDDAPVD